MVKKRAFFNISMVVVNETFFVDFHTTYYVPSNEDRRQCMQAGHALPISSLAYKRTTFSDVIHFFS